MSNWLRFFLTFLSSVFRSKQSLSEEFKISLWVWVTDADLQFVNESRYMCFLEMGRLDLMIRTGFIWKLIKEKIHAPVASLKISFLRPLRRWQKIEVHSRIEYHDEKWIFIRQKIVYKNKIMSEAAVKATLRKGKTTLSLEKVLKEMKLQALNLERPLGLESSSL